MTEEDSGEDDAQRIIRESEQPHQALEYRKSGSIPRATINSDTLIAGENYRALQPCLRGAPPRRLRLRSVT